MEHLLFPGHIEAVMCIAAGTSGHRVLANAGTG